MMDSQEFGTYAFLQQQISELHAKIAALSERDNQQEQQAATLAVADLVLAEAVVELADAQQEQQAELDVVAEVVEEIQTEEEEEIEEIAPIEEEKETADAGETTQPGPENDSQEGTEGEAESGTLSEPTVIRVEQSAVPAEPAIKRRYGFRRGVGPK